MLGSWTDSIDDVVNAGAQITANIIALKAARANAKNSTEALKLQKEIAQQEAELSRIRAEAGIRKTKTTEKVVKWLAIGGTTAAVAWAALA